MVNPFWNRIRGNELAQGDLLLGCLVPEYGAEFGAGGEGSAEELTVGEQTLIIITQSCDLENDKVQLVAMCPAYSKVEYEQQNTHIKKNWENVRKGRIEGLHLLGDPDNPDNNSGALVVDFGLVFSLPLAYLKKKADASGERLRLHLDRIA